MDPDEFGIADVERLADHDIHGVGATDTDRHHAQAACVGGVAVGADHEPARECVVLEYDLVDDPAAGFPEADAVPPGSALEEVVHLDVGVLGTHQVGQRAFQRLDQVVAVDRGRGGDLVEARGHELEDGHLCGGVLHRDPVRGEVGVAHRTFDPAAFGVGQVVDQYLLGRSERPTEPLAPPRGAIAESLVHAVDQFDGCGSGCRHGILLARRRFCVHRQYRQV